MPSLASLACGCAGLVPEAQWLQEMVSGACAALRRSERACRALLGEDCGRRKRALEELEREVEGEMRAVQAKSEASLAQFLEAVFRVVEAEMNGQRVAELVFPDLCDDQEDQEDQEDESREAEGGEGGEGGEGEEG